MTQEQLAQLLGVTRQSVSRWESDIVYPETDKIVKIAEILQVNCDYLLKKDVFENGEQKFISPITRLLKNTTGKRIKIKLFEDSDDYDLIGNECMIVDFDGEWANVEIFKRKKTENKLIPVSSIVSITLIKGKE